MQWNLTFIRMTGISNTISILKIICLGHVVQKLEKCQKSNKGHHSVKISRILFKSLSCRLLLNSKQYAKYQSLSSYTYTKKGSSSSIIFRPEKKKKHESGILPCATHIRNLSHQLPTVPVV